MNAYSISFLDLETGKTYDVLIYNSWDEDEAKFWLGEFGSDDYIRQLYIQEHLEQPITPEPKHGYTRFCLIAIQEFNNYDAVEL